MVCYQCLSIMAHKYCCCYLFAILNFMPHCVACQCLDVWQVCMCELSALGRHKHSGWSLLFSVIELAFLTPLHYT